MEDEPGEEQRLVLEAMKGRVAGYPLVAALMLPIAKRRLRLPDASGSDLLSFLQASLGDDAGLEALEAQLQKASRVENFGAVFRLTLGDSPDAKISQALSEVRAAEILTDRYARVVKREPPAGTALQPKTCDFIVHDGTRRFPVEVKDIGG